MRIAIERSWLIEPDADQEEEDTEALLEGDERDPDLSESLSPLALLARAERTPAEVADAAADWHETCRFGLWLVEDPNPAPGVRLTEIVSGARRYVEIAPEQLEGLARWSVLLGAIVCLEGIWHTTGTFISLSPAEGDAAASLVSEADHLQRRGEPVPGFRALRAELSMERWWDLPANAHREPHPHRRRSRR